MMHINRFVDRRIRIRASVLGTRIVKPLTAYMYYVQSRRDALLAQPDIHQQEIGTLLTNEWEQLSESDKAPFVELYRKDKARLVHTVTSSSLRSHLVTISFLSSLVIAI
jgi:hypothetical protein